MSPNPDFGPSFLHHLGQPEGALKIRSGACGLVWLARASRLFTLAALRGILLESLLLGDTNRFSPFTFTKLIIDKKWSSARTKNEAVFNYCIAPFALEEITKDLDVTL
ncbi:hypothetical protein RF11_05686 [Thelohanellus kitauei]|uniref:Uncharacterized protein n=1 Tax=Thelohanellus kitauei TaxID=669202 RepID=A0A0C2JV86_THEKT|nr:hypothetical protein RF11_05686 [Thelohanellus kitauei]